MRIVARAMSAFVCPWRHIGAAKLRAAAVRAAAGVCAKAAAACYGLGCPIEHGAEP